MALRLSVPEPVAHLSIKPETNPTRLQNWLRGLSTTDALGSATPILDALATLNRFRLDADERTGLLDLYQTAVDIRFAPLCLLFENQPLPLGGVAREARQKTEALLSELAAGYKLVLVDRLEKRRAFAPVKTLPALTARVMRLLLQQLEISYGSYSPIAQHLWSDLHQLFLIGVQQRWLDAPERSRETISVLYKRALLLALADPYRLPPGAFDRARQLLADMGSLAQFESAADLKAETGGFWVKLDEDRPPFFAVQRPQDLDARTDISLNTHLLARALARYIADLERQHPDGSEDVQCLRQLLRFWTVTPRRGFQRLSSLSQVEVRLGWPDLSVVGLGQQPWPVEAGGGFLWQISNESAGGFALRGERVYGLPAAVGQLLAVRPLGGERWLITVIRWLQQSGDSIELGVQVLAPFARVAELRGDTTRPVLVLPAVKGVRQPSTILSPTVVTLGAYVLDAGVDACESVVLSRVMERTPCLVQTGFKLADAAQTDASSVLPDPFGEVGQGER